MESCDAAVQRLIQTTYIMLGIGEKRSAMPTLLLSPARFAPEIQYMPSDISTR
jgi:hypothetical protein